MEKDTWPAPAKLNLFLQITGRRADGYHLLQTVFQFVDLADQLTFEITDDAVITRVTDLQGIPGDQDLIVRAAKKLQQASGCRRGSRIHIEKRIPLGGGLGGGSSDAATTLLALNRLWQVDLPMERLVEIGLELGADVPVFIRGKAAWAEGVGEQLEAIDLPEPWYLIVYPDCHVTTADVFNADDLTRNTPPITIRDFLAGAGSNNCEPVVRKMYPVVDEALEWLNQYAPAKLTGTGACLFAAFEKREQAHEVCQCLPTAWRGFVTQGRNRSSLLDKL